MIQCGVWEALERRAAANRKKMTDRSLKDFEFLSGQQQKLIKQWCFPVLGFNSRCYDLKLIKKHLVTKIAQADNMKVATKLMMFMSTESFFTSRTISGQAPVMPNGCRRTAPSFQNRGFRTSGSTPPRSWTSQGSRRTKSTGFQIWKTRRFSLLYQESNRRWICRCRSLWWRVLFAL